MLPAVTLSVVMSRLQSTFGALRSKGKKSLVAYLTAGDPTEAASIEAALCVADAGADVLEVGIPFSDPTADGPVIQRAMLRSLQSGGGFASALRVVKAVRDARPSLPMVAFGYLNPFVSKGLEDSLGRAAEAGVDGLLVVDAPYEEAAPIAAAAKESGLDWVSLVAPTTGHERAKSIASSATGFVYMISMTGVTGSDFAGVERVKPLVASIRDVTSVPVCVGFGVRDRESAAAAAEVADGVVVGSALVSVLEKGGALNDLGRLVGQLRAGVDSAN